MLYTAEVPAHRNIGLDSSHRSRASIQHQPSLLLRAADGNAHLEPVDPATVTCEILGKGTRQDECHASEGEIAVDKEAELDGRESRRPDV